MHGVDDSFLRKTAPWWAEKGALHSLVSSDDCNKEALLEESHPRAKMAALKWGWGAVFIWIFVGLLLICDCDSVENSNESDGNKKVDQSVSQHGEESSNEEVQGEKQQWQMTDFGINDALEDDKADSGMNDSPGEGRAFTPPPAKDHFQEELVIRPLHSGDIYASFQFHTQLDTDFVQEAKKGCL